MTDDLKQRLRSFNDLPDNERKRGKLGIIRELIGLAADALDTKDAEIAKLREERDEAVRNAEVVCNSYAVENQQLHDRATAAEAELAKARADAGQAHADLFATQDDALTPPADVAELVERMLLVQSCDVGQMENLLTEGAALITAQAARIAKLERERDDALSDAVRRNNDATDFMLRATAAEAERDKLKAENERLREMLRSLQQWARAYPLSVFPEPDFAKVRQLLEAGGITVDAVSASNMRHVLNGIDEIVRAALKETDHD